MRKKILYGIILCSCMFLLIHPNKSLASENSEGGQWVQDTKGKWYQNADSTYPKNQWWLIGGERYLFDDNGYLLTGWQKVGTETYYLNEAGVIHTGWLTVDGKQYYFGENGEMQTGWVRLESSWYYLNQSGVMQTGWVKTNGDWYHLDSNGKMVLGTKTFDGSVYKFDTDGALKSVSMNTDEVSGGYYVAIYNELEQALLDDVNEKRGSSKSVVVDQTINSVAEARLSAAITYGYYAKGKTITGQGTVKDYMKSINYKTNKNYFELYIRGVSDIDAALSSLDTAYNNSSLTSYTNIGISVQEKNNKIYAMLVFMK